MLSGLKSTANLTALGRAVSCFEAEPRLRGPDDMAIRFLDPPLSLVPRSRLLRRLAILLYERLLPGAYLYTIARTKYIDAVLHQELENGIRQIVILGAGFDSRAYRIHNSFQDARFIEVDYPANSMRKAQKVSMLLGSPPDYVTFLPLDMNAESLDSGLSRAGQDPLQRTLFVAEGLTMYLTAAAVDEMLACIRRRSGARSSIVFDYVYRSIIEEDTTLYGAAEAVRLVRKRGEPFLFGIAEGEIGRFLAERGFECAVDLRPAELERSYMSREDGSLFGRVVGYWSLAYARRVQE